MDCLQWVYSVPTMHLDVSKVTSAKGVSYTRVLLRSSFREDGKIKHRTLGNLSNCSEDEIQAVRLALKHKGKLSAFIAQGGVGEPAAAALGQISASEPAGPFIQGPSVGAIIVLREIARQLGIVEALGDDKQGRLALWQVIARALDQGSRLSATRLARDLGAACVLDLPAFDRTTCTPISPGSKTGSKVWSNSSLPIITRTRLPRFIFTM